MLSSAQIHSGDQGDGDPSGLFQEGCQALTEGTCTAVHRASCFSTSSGRVATDSIGFYLSSIGRIPLLTAAEEIELAHHVQGMKKLQDLPDGELTSRQRHQIRMGKRARDRMMAANLRLVVSVAKKYQNQGLSSWTWFRRAQSAWNAPWTSSIRPWATSFQPMPTGGSAKA